MLLEHGAAVRIDLAEGDGFKPARPLKAEAKSADTGKQVEDFKFLHIIPPLSQCFGSKVDFLDRMPWFRPVEARLHLSADFLCQQA